MAASTAWSPKTVMRRFGAGDSCFCGPDPDLRVSRREVVREVDSEVRWDAAAFLSASFASASIRPARVPAFIPRFGAGFSERGDAARRPVSDPRFEDFPPKFAEFFDLCFILT